jgi:hypothetical protein
MGQKERQSHSLEYNGNAIKKYSEEEIVKNEGSVSGLAKSLMEYEK